MFCNLASLKIESYRAKHRPNGTVYIELSSTNKPNNYRYSDCFYMSIGQAYYLSQCLKGEIDPDDKLGIVDLSHVIIGKTRGLQIIKASDPQSNYTFPGRWIAQWIESAIAGLPDDIAVNDKSTDYTLSPVYSRTYGKDITDTIAAAVAPKVTVEYHHDRDYKDGDFVVVVDVEKRLIRDMSDPRQTRLGQCMDSLRRIASGYSDGQEAILHIRLDNSYWARNRPDEPANYFWWITVGDKNGMHGGLIAHRQSDDWQYSTHT